MFDYDEQKTISIFLIWEAIFVRLFYCFSYYYYYYSVFIRDSIQLINHIKLHYFFFYIERIIMNFKCIMIYNDVWKNKMDCF